MKTNLFLLASLLFGIMIFLISCKSDLEIDTHIYSDEEYAIISEYLNLPNLNVFDSPDHFKFRLPDHVGGEKVNVHTMKATLGKVLFYDKDLSIDRTTSCASCHKQDKAFSDDVAFSVGANGNLTDRNSIAIGSFFSIQSQYGTTSTSLGAANRLFWDARAHDFNEQMSETFLNPKEMGITPQELERRVNSKKYYNILAEKAFNDENLSADLIKIALEEFMSTFHTTNSFFDSAIDADGQSAAISIPFYKFSNSQNLGKKLFNDHCNSCHGGAISPSQNFIIHRANNGLDMEYEDNGIGDFSSYEFDNGKFKVPSLRNISVTAPYMHDGRFETLEEVIDFYSDGIQAHPNLHHKLKEDDGTPIKLELTKDERTALVDFLKTLTDDSFLVNPLFSNPFKS